MMSNRPGGKQAGPSLRGAGMLVFVGAVLAVAAVLLPVRALASAGSTTTSSTSSTSSGSSSTTGTTTAKKDEDAKDIPDTEQDKGEVTGRPRPEAGYDKNLDKHWSPACDGDVMNTIFARSWLNAQQDILINQLMIKKPDSVLEYSCFDENMGVVADTIAPLFSETQKFKSVTVDIGSARGSRMIQTGFAQDTGAMRKSLNKAIMPALNTFIDTNFWHDFLGGVAGFDRDIPDEAGDGSYTCDVMATVWKVAKCENFMAGYYEQRGNGLFYEFEDLIGFDPRKYPDPQQCNNSLITQEMIDLSNNAVKAFSRLPPPVPPSYAKSKTYHELLDPANCEGTYPVPTGLTARQKNVIKSGDLPIRTEQYTYPEYTCVNAACHYDREQKKCVE